MKQNEYIPSASALTNNKSHLCVLFINVLSNLLRYKKIKQINFRIGKGKAFLHSLIKDDLDFVFFMGSKTHGKELELYCVKKEIEYLGEYEGNDWCIIREGNLPLICDEIIENINYKEGRDCDSLKGILVHKKYYQEVKGLLSIKLKDKLFFKPTFKNIQLPPFCSLSWIKEYSKNE